jgi:hypothetical protein
MTMRFRSANGPIAVGAVSNGNVADPVTAAA